MGWIGEEKMNVGFVVPLVCFLIIMAYGIFLSRTEALPCATLRV